MKGGPEVSLAESITQYGLGGLFIFLLASAVLGIWGDAAIDLITGNTQGDKLWKRSLRFIVSSVIGFVLACCVAYIIYSKQYKVNHAADLLNGNWAISATKQGCAGAVTYEVDIASNTLTVREPDDFILTYDIDYVLPNYVQVHLHGNGEIRIFERKDNQLAQRVLGGQSGRLIRC